MPVLIARHYATGEPLQVEWDVNQITHVHPSPESPDGWIAPAFLDIQINGGLAISFNSAELTIENIRQVTDLLRQHGIGRYLPTLITGGFEAIRHGFATLEAARHQAPELAAAIPGYHLEGPYLSGADGPRGAHPLEHIRDPNWDEFQRWQAAAGGNIKLVTLAPERPGALEFISQLTASGVVVAIAHTAATPAEIQAAIQAGAKLSTHLGNGSHALLPRHENYLWEQLASDDLWASIISDGHHLPPAILKCITRVKTAQRLIVTCDASSLAGLPPGKYQHWGHELEVLPSGKIIVPGTPFLAGSGQFTDHCVEHLLRQKLLSLAEAIDVVTVQPAALLGLPRPAVEVGPTRRLVQFDWDGTTFQVRRLI